MAITLQNLKDFAQDNIGKNDAKTTRAISRGIFRAIRKVFQERNWNFIRERRRVNTIAPYETGTLSVNHESADVTGSGTTWSTGWINPELQISGESLLTAISAVGSTTSMTLQNGYLASDEANVSGASYKVLFPRVTLPSGSEGYTQAVDFVANARDGDPLKQVPPALIMELIADSVRIEEPDVYAIRHLADGSRQLLLYPIPDKAYPLDVQMYLRPAEPVDDADDTGWPEKWNELIEMAVLMCVGQELGNQELRARGSASYGEVLARCVREDAEDATPFVVGGGSMPAVEKQWEIIRR